MLPVYRRTNYVSLRDTSRVSVKYIRRMSEYNAEYSSDGGGSELLPATQAANTGSATLTSRGTRPADSTGITAAGGGLPRDVLITRLKRLLGMKGTQQQVQLFVAHELQVLPLIGGCMLLAALHLLGYSCEHTDSASV